LVTALTANHLLPSNTHDCSPAVEQLSQITVYQSSANILTQKEYSAQSTVTYGVAYKHRNRPRTL